jgi:hypothetical protein
MVRHLLTECWIKKVWKETSEYGIHIVERTTSLQTECIEDRMLMEAFMQNGYKGKELCELNKCQLYLRCTTLADLANGKGDKLLTAALHCHCLSLIERSQFEWPTQLAWNPSQQLLLRKALHKCFTRHRRSTV